MATWTSHELDTIDTTDELRIATARGDGTLRTARIVWVVRLGDGLYVRSVNGPDAAWYRGTQTRHEGRISSGGVHKDVSFVAADTGLDDAIDAAYRDKYHRYPAPVSHIVSEPARATTLKLVPR